MLRTYLYTPNLNNRRARGGYDSLSHVLPLVLIINKVIDRIGGDFNVVL